MGLEIYTILGTMLGGFVSLGLFMWKVTDRLDRKIDGLAKDHQALARELSELGGEIRGRRFGTPETQPAE